MREFEIAVIGAGTAGLTVAAGAARLGVSTAIIERSRFGGECLWTGCVPSKTMIRSGMVARLARGASAFGVKSAGTEVDFQAVIDRIADVISRVGVRDDPERFSRLGVANFSGEASISAKDRRGWRLSIRSPGGGEEIRADKVVIATGSRTRIPEIPGLREAGFITHVEVFSLKRLPESLLILGGGPIGIEFAQLFSRLGSRVTVLERGRTILGNDDPEMSLLLEEILKSEGIALEKEVEAVSVRQLGERKIVTCRHRDGGREEYAGAEILVATGRRPNVEGLGLAEAGVAFDTQGVIVDRRLRTSAKGIWAAGDVTPGPQFTHVAEYAGRIVVANAAIGIPWKADYERVPWCTFTDPEIAKVGLTEPAARERFGDGFELYRFDLSELDRALCDSDAAGRVKILVRRGRLIGAHLLAPRAGDLIAQFVLAMEHNLPLRAVASAIYIYPTYAEALRRAADAYVAARLFSPAGRRIINLLRRLRLSG